MNKIKIITLYSTLFFSSSLLSMVCDNQWIPLFPKPYSRTEEKPSHFYIDAFFLTADKAYDHRENEKQIPDLYGVYDQEKLGRALQIVGKNNPLPDEFRVGKILWGIQDKLQGQGVSLAFEHRFFKPLSIGFSWFLARISNRHEFCLKTDEVGFRIKEDGDLREIKEARLLMHKELGLCEAHSSHVGMSDFDCYLRVGGIWDYAFKCRTVDAGISFGLIVPSGRKREVESAASLPFGGNGHWGIFVRGDTELELKEDMKFGCMVRVNKRFEKIMDMRLPVDQEHPLYGALVAPVSVEPGMNIVFSPYVSMENLREGLGVRAGLHIVKHGEDCFVDVRSNRERKTVPSKTAEIRRRSSWGADYGSFHLFYDFGKMDVEKSYKPVITLSWDVPFLVFASSNISKTHRVSLGLEVKF